MAFLVYSAALGLNLSQNLYLIIYIRGGSRISGKGVLMIKSVFVCLCVCVCGGGRFADFISCFSNIPWKRNKLVSLRPNYFIFIRYLKNGRNWGGTSEPPLDLPLHIHTFGMQAVQSLGNLQICINWPKPSLLKKAINTKISPTDHLCMYIENLKWVLLKITSFLMYTILNINNM